MPPRLDPYSLRLFLSAAEEKSIARAAAKESIAPSALSRRISELEHVFGIALFVRSAHGIQLTDAGRIAFERVGQMEIEIESLVSEVRSLSGVISGRVRLFANSSSVVGFLPERLKVFGAAYPMVSIALQERRSSEVVRACLDDVADVGVCIIDAVPNGLDAWRFADDPLIAVLPPSHPLCEQQRLHFSEIVQHSLVAIQSGGALDRLLRDQAGTIGVELRVAISVNSFDGVCRMVEAGLGIAIVPNSAAAGYAGSARFERRVLDEPWARRELRLISLPKNPRPKAVEALIEALRH